MCKYEYSKELVNIVKQFLVDDDWQFSFDENIGVFDFALRVKSKIQKIIYKVDVHEDKIIVYGICPIDADYRDTYMMQQMAEFLCRANYNLMNGCFELDFRDGEIRFRSFIDCEELRPSAEVIKNSIYCTAVTFKRYATGILDVIFSNCTAKEAIAKCEKSLDEEIRSMVSEAVGEDMEDTDIAEMIERLAAKYESSEGDGDSGTSDEIYVNLYDGKKEGGVMDVTG